MANSGFLWTDAGLSAATAALPGGPYIHIASFRLGAGFGYSPSRSQVALSGSTLYTGVPLTYTVQDDGLDVILPVGINVGDFSFGEIGLYDSSNVLLAVCVFTNLQEKVRAVGNQAGNQYLIHARLKLAQAVAIVQVTISNTMSILEVPNWQSLLPPIGQLNGANAVIVQEKNASLDPIFVIRETNTEWGIVGYGKVFEGGVADIGASITTDTFTHTGLANLYFDMPQTQSRYLIKFDTGDIRRISSQSTPTSVTWTPALGYTPAGTIKIYEDNTTRAVGNLTIASILDYNDLATDFNRFWSTPSGSYSATNAGINQVAIPTLTNRPTLTDWTLLSTSLRKLMTLENYTTAQINAVLDKDWIWRPENQSANGLYYMTEQFKQIYTNIKANLDSSRNLLNVAQTETFVLASLARARTLPFLSNIVYDFKITQPSENIRKGFANAGTLLTITPLSGTQTNFFIAWDTLFDLVGSVVIDRGTSYSSLGVGTGSVFGFANMDSTLRTLYTHSRVDGTLSATTTLTVQGQTDGTGGYNIKVTLTFTGSPYSSPDPGTMSIAVSNRRPLTTLIDNPAFAYFTGTQLVTSTF